MKVPPPPPAGPAPRFRWSRLCGEGAEPGRHTESKRGECGWGGPATRGSRGREVSGVRLGERRAGQAGLGLDRVPSRVGVWGCPGRRNSLGVGVRAGGGAGAEEGLEGARASGACHCVPRALLLVSEVSGMPDCRSRLTPQPQGWETRWDATGRETPPEPSGIRQTGWRWFTQGRRYGLGLPADPLEPPSHSLGYLLVERH